MTIAAPKLTSIPAHPTNYRRDRLGRFIRVIVIHSAETGEGSTPAEGVGNWFARPSVGGSTHTGSDTDSICRYVADTDTAAGAPGVNVDGLHHELAGRASQTSAQWADADSIATMTHAARQCAAWAVKWSIPLVWLTDAQIRDGKTKGFLCHMDASRAFATPGGHGDPGPNFPRAWFLGQVAAFVAELTGTPTKPPAKPPVKPVPAKPGAVLKLGSRGNAVARLQLGLMTVFPAYSGSIKASGGADGRFGPATEGVVREFQRRSGLVPDGIVGALTRAALAAHKITI